MIIATLTIFLGTIYPIILEVITDNRISVGGPYFNSTVIPSFGAHPFSAKIGWLSSGVAMPQQAA